MIIPTVPVENNQLQNRTMRNNVGYELQPLHVNQGSEFEALLNTLEYGKSTTLYTNIGLLTFSLIPLSGISWTINYGIHNVDYFQNKIIVRYMCGLGFLLAFSVALTAFFGFNLYINLFDSSRAIQDSLSTTNRDNLSSRANRENLLTANQEFLPLYQPRRPSAIHQFNQMPPQYEEVIRDAATAFI